MKVKEFLQQHQENAYLYYVGAYIETPTKDHNKKPILKYISTDYNFKYKKPFKEVNKFLECEIVKIEEHKNEVSYLGENGSHFEYGQIAIVSQEDYFKAHPRYKKQLEKLEQFYNKPKSKRFTL